MPKKAKVRTWKHTTKGTLFTSANASEMKKWYGSGWKLVPNKKATEIKKLGKQSKERMRIQSKEMDEWTKEAAKRAKRI